jgi:hypothetical protein
MVVSTATINSGGAARCTRYRPEKFFLRRGDAILGNQILDDPDRPGKKGFLGKKGFRADGDFRVSFHNAPHLGTG